MDSDTPTPQQNPASPAPEVNTPSDDVFNEQLNGHHDIPPDKDIDPDTSLSGYQDDIDTATNPSKQDTVQYEQGTDPKNYMQMPRGDLKEGLDEIAFDEQANTSPTDSPSDDWREHVEDMDEGDTDKR